MTLPRVYLIVGTRPEAIKMAPLVNALRSAGHFEPIIIASGQHPVMPTQALAAFGLRPDIVLSLNRPTGAQSELVAELCPALDRVLGEDRPAAVVVQGDTTTALVGGLTAFWRGIPIVHLEAGLRSGTLSWPFPEEANRRLLSVISELHLAPTQRAADILLLEGVDPSKVLLTGNTVVDAVLTTAARDVSMPDPRLEAAEQQAVNGDARLMLATCHRREAWGAPMSRVLEAIRQILENRPDMLCILPAHANPVVRDHVTGTLGRHPQVIITCPLEYQVLCRLLAVSSIVLSDSGGIQEEAPSFGVPVLVLREVTERVEAVEAGWAQLVGTDVAQITTAAKELLDEGYVPPQAQNPFGDGHAGRRCAEAIAWFLDAGPRPDEFKPNRLGSNTSVRGMIPGLFAS